jgi:hypothetical protein
MTDQELQGIAWQALNMAKTDLEHGNEFSGLIATYFEGEGLRRMTRIEKQIREQIGIDWLNNGAAKDAVFDVLRMGARVQPVDGFVFVTAANYFRSTEKLTALDPAEVERQLAKGHDHHHRMAKEGLLTIQDSLIATAQTPERACIIVQAVGPKGEFVDKPDTRYFDQAEFDGRLKMFGEGRYQRTPHHSTRGR